MEGSFIVLKFRPLRPLRALLALFLLGIAWAPSASAAPAPTRFAGPTAQDDLESLLAAELAEADLLRRRGRSSSARRRLGEILEDDPTDAEARRLMALCRLDEGRHEQAQAQAAQALESARKGDNRVVLAACARTAAEILLEVGRPAEALELLVGDFVPAGGAAEPLLDPTTSARDGLALGRALLASGDREAARVVFEQALDVRRDAPWREHLAAGQCARALGRLTAASRSFARADRVAQGGEGPEPDVLAALAAVYFESEREVEAKGKRSAADLYRAALELHPTHAPSLLGLFELHRYNRRRVSRSPEAILGDLLGAVPDSVPGLVAKVSADLSDGRLKSARKALARVEALAPGRRDVKTLRAALAWIEHDREGCERRLAALAAEDSADSRPEREVGAHLVALYRFAEAAPFLRRAVERDDGDWDAWRLLGQALANTGAEEEAAEALARSEKVAGGRQDALRSNLSLVLERMRASHVIEKHGALEFSWSPETADVLRTYLVPFYLQAREDLARRYGHTPGTTRIEVFRAHRDFSVRSVGFEGFPALGVCFGPVVTALSPLSEMRGRFSWARTGFHEFSHVVHLGLSHNRCPRWITEGLATWEEVRRDPSWSRNMRRDLLDIHANGDLILVRDLNRAFRGPRILFGYYEGGLLCEMLIGQYGFTAMVHLLEQFDQGRDLDQAFEAVLGVTPEQVDEAFEAFVVDRLEGLDIEPRWDPARIVRLRLRLKRVPPEDAEARGPWVDQWLSVAWGSWQRKKKLDAQEALRIAGLAGPEGPRALSLRGEMALDSALRDRARELWTEAVAAGGRDYRALIGLAGLCEQAGDDKAAERYLLMAERSFPGYDAITLSAERKLAALYDRLGREDDAASARERWLAFNAGAYPERMQVARWHREAGRLKRADELYREANEVDPFRRNLHLAWGAVLFEQERWEEALREFGVALVVPPKRDLDHLEYVGPPDGLPLGVDPENVPAAVARGINPEFFIGIALTTEEQIPILEAMASCARGLGREEEAKEYAQRIKTLEEKDR